MADEATETPPAGEEQSHVQTGAPEGTSAATTEPEYFSENFDPSTLDEALQPAYKQMQGAWTKKTQELAEQRKQAESATAFFNDLQSEDNREGALAWLADNLGGPDQLIAALGYQFNDDTDQTDLDPTEQMRSEWEQFKAQQSQREAQQAEEAYVSQVDAHLVEGVKQINAQLSQQGRDALTDDEQRLVVKNALVDTEAGQMPNVQGAYETYANLMDARLKDWANTKRGGATRAGGEAATQVPDLDDERQRQDYIAQRLTDMQSG